MVRFVDRNSKGKVLCCKKRSVWDVNDDNIDISNLVKSKTNSKCLTGY